MPCILSISFWSLQHLLGLYHFCPLLGLSLAKILHWYFQVFLRDLVFPLLLLYSSFIHCSLKKAFLSLHAIFFRALHLIGCTFPFLPCFSLLLFLQLFVKSPQTTTLPSCISFSLVWFCSLPSVWYYTDLHPQFFRHTVY